MFEEKSLLRAFLEYLQAPAYSDKFENQSQAQKFRNSFKLWSFGIVITFFTGWLLTFLLGKTDYDESSHSVVELFLNYPTIVFIMLAFVWGPITEELTFRLGLKYSPYGLGYALILLLSLLFSLLLSWAENFNQAWASFFYDFLEQAGSLSLLYYALFIALGGWLLGYLFNQKIKTSRVTEFYRANFKYIFYFSAIAFALVHLFNFQSFAGIWHLAPLLVAPQFFLGLLLAYLRMLYGLSWAIGIHAMHNAFLTTPVLVFSLISEDLLVTISEGASIADLNISSTDSLLILFSTSLALLLGLAVLVSFASLLREYYKKR